MGYTGFVIFPGDVPTNVPTNLKLQVKNVMVNSTILLSPIYFHNVQWQSELGHIRIHATSAYNRYLHLIFSLSFSLFPPRKHNVNKTDLNAS